MNGMRLSMFSFFRESVDMKRLCVYNFLAGHSKMSWNYSGRLLPTVELAQYWKVLCKLLKTKGNGLTQM